LTILAHHDRLAKNQLSSEIGTVPEKSVLIFGDTQIPLYNIIGKWKYLGNDARLHGYNGRLIGIHVIY